MELSLGFLLLTHSQPIQIERLVRRINELFGAPLIVCHHDFRRCPIRAGLLPGNVELVQPALKTYWGTWSIVEASVRALEQMFDRPRPPDWFVLLSGADYPICSAEQMISQLAESDCDAFVEHTLVDPATAATPWQKHCARRYFSRRVWIPFWNRNAGRSWKSVVISEHPLLRGRVPFSENFCCYYGSQFLTGNRRSAERVIELRQTDRAFERHCRKCPIPDEIYFSTILANSPGLRLKNGNLRYIDWRNGGPHPKLLRNEDLPDVLASGMHFARKFSPESEILDAIDRIVDAR